MSFLSSIEGLFSSTKVLPINQQEPSVSVAGFGEVSEAALQMIIGFEVTSAAYYTKHYQAPTWAGGMSGLTIGVGYDIGYVTVPMLKADWGEHLDEATLAKLAPACGIKGSAAERLLATLCDVIVPWDAAISVFRDISILAYSKQTKAAFLNCDMLPGDCFGALASIVYNRGAAMNDGSVDPAHRRLEMREIRDAMAAKEFAKVPGFIRDMKRLWTNGLVQRREDEAVMFENAIGKIAL